MSLKIPELVRAKFYCHSITKYMGGVTNPETGKYEPCPVHNYIFNAVSSGSEENKKFFASTPTGRIELSAVRADLFEIGKEYYLDFAIAQ